MRRLPILLAVLLGLSACTTLPPKPPNIIVLITDDQGYGDFGAKGNPVLQTPHLDAMAARSAEMTTFYVSPVCSPTRASLMTGRYNYRTRVVDTWIGRSMMEPEEVTLAEMLGDAGYATGLFGKWHLGDSYPMRPQDQGFDEVLMHRGGGIAQPSDPIGGERKYTDPVLLHNGEPIQAEGYCTDVYFDHALNWIGDQDTAEQPFFAYIAMNAPHDPFHDVPEDWLARYQAMNLANDQYPQDNGHPLPDENQQLDRRARIFAMISNIDDNVGRLFEHLDGLDLTRETIVVYLNDNGPMGNRYRAGFRGGKGGVYEGGVRSPLWVHWPGRLDPGPSSDAPAAHIDLVPTLLDAADVTPPAEVNLDGRSLWPLLTRADNPSWADRPLVIQSHRGDEPQRYHHFLLRTDRWKLLHNSGFGREHFEGEPDFQLYDLRADPYEMTDVATANPDVVADLQAQYDAWFDDVTTTRPDNFAKPRIVIDPAQEPITTLTRQDWHDTGIRNWTHPQTNGYWALDVAEAGTYDIQVRASKGLTAETLTLDVNGMTYTAPAPSDYGTHTFEAVPLDAGALRLMATLTTADGEQGAWHIDVSKS